MVVWPVRYRYAPTALPSPTAPPRWPSYPLAALDTVAANEREAVEKAAAQFRIPPERQSKLVVTNISEREVSTSSRLASPSSTARITTEWAGDTSCWWCCRNRVVKFATELGARMTNHVSTLRMKANLASH